MLKADTVCTPVILTLVRMQQEDCALKVTLDLMVRTYLKTNQQGLGRLLPV